MCIYLSMRFWIQLFSIYYPPATVWYWLHIKVWCRQDTTSLRYSVKPTGCLIDDVSPGETGMMNWTTLHVLLVHVSNVKCGLLKGGYLSTWKWGDVITHTLIEKSVRSEVIVSDFTHWACWVWFVFSVSERTNISVQLHVPVVSHAT